MKKKSVFSSLCLEIIKDYSTGKANFDLIFNVNLKVWLIFLQLGNQNEKSKKNPFKYFKLHEHFYLFIVMSIWKILKFRTEIVFQTDHGQERLDKS